MRCVVYCGSTSFPCHVVFFASLPWGSTIYKHTGRWLWQGECISRISELREMLLSFQTGFNLVNATVVCAVLERISGMEPSSIITEPRYLKLVTISGVNPFTLISVLMQLMLSSTLPSRHWAPCRRLWRLCQNRRRQQRIEMKLVWMLIIILRANTTRAAVLVRKGVL